MRIVQESVSCPFVHFDAEFLFILVEGLTKEVDFRLGGAGIIGPVVTQERRAYVFQILRLWKQTLIVNNSPPKARDCATA